MSKKLPIKKAHWTHGSSCSCWEVKTMCVLSERVSNTILCGAKNKVYVIKVTSEELMVGSDVIYLDISYFLQIFSREE